ncbi:MAG: electron transfer flavoprotein subunit alpha/FixB family protein [Candidatus Hodarchaeales archaeon]|jgi:electron transfer flavoprotein alpha subunit
MSNEILVFVEHQAGAVSNPSKSAFTAAQALAEEKGWKISALVAGTDLESVVKESITLGASKVYSYDHSELKFYRSMPYSRVLLQTVNDYSPEVIIFGYSTTSTDFPPRASVALKSAIITGVSALEWDEDTLVATKPAFKEKLNFKFAIKGTPRMVILGIGVFPGAKSDSSLTGEVINCTPNFEDGDLVETIVSTEVVEKMVDLSEAKLIVSGGRGVGGKDKFQVIYDAAKAFGGEWASSRAVHDAGWTETDQHLGQTGQQVGPDIYIAAGISGAIQHTAGIKSSKTIISINTDPEAPMWDVSHYGIVGDLHKVLPLLIDKIKS